MSYDVRFLYVGQTIAFSGVKGKIIARVEQGQLISDALQRAKDEFPEAYDAYHVEPPTSPVTTVRYICLVESKASTKLRWPYLFNIQGVIDEKQDSEKSQSQSEGSREEEKAG